MNDRQDAGLLGPAEVQQTLGISTSTYYRWLRSGRLRGVRVGGRWRFPPEVVEVLLGQDPDGSELARALSIYATRLAALGRPQEDLKMSATAPPSEAHQLADRVISHALARGATDVHLEPVAQGLGVRERIDGRLDALDPPLPEGARTAIIDAIKQRAGLSGDGPGQGRFFAPYEGRQIDVRAATFPTGLGDSVTLRLLDPATVISQLGRLGLAGPLQDRLTAAFEQPSGVVLTTGPSGHGKTTLLYSLMLARQSPELKLMTAEDPVELHLDGILQTNAGRIGFVPAMRAMLANDLDVGMVSELRDAESIQLLFQMAGTGHMMCAALHAPTALGAIQRLLEIGQVPPRLVCENLRAVLAQRLVPRSCRSCRETGPLASDDAAALGLASGTPVSHNAGCEACHGRGTRGRVLLGELVEPSPGLLAAIEQGETRAEALALMLPRDHPGLTDDLRRRVVEGDVNPTVARALRLG